VNPGPVASGTTSVPGSGAMPSLLPPWGTEASWQEANRTMIDLVLRFRSFLRDAELQGHRIAADLETLFPILDALCFETCPDCQAPCCTRARPWIDFTDLVFLYLTGQAVPVTQLIPGPDRSCRFLGCIGCTLPRMSRPWICTWYLCPVQERRLGNRPSDIRSGLRSLVRTIKTGRRRLEETFISIATR
jgi:hypothetical protein